VIRSVLAGVALTFVVAAPVNAATYTATESVPAVVWVSDVAPDPATGIEIHQTMKAFAPSFVIVPIGTTILFPNDDAFYHSVYSESPGNAFDLGLYDTGPGKSVRFLSAGLVDIRCHVHGTMHATVIVVDGPYAQATATNLRIRIDGIAPGRHVVHTWTGGSTVAETTVTIK
jgi:plastocyanin